MGISSETTITLKTRTKLLPVLQVLLNSGWRPHGLISFDNISWYPATGDQSLKLEPVTKLSEILNEINMVDNDPEYQGYFGIHLVVLNEQEKFTGGFFYFYYDPDQCSLVVDWNYSRMLVNNQRGVTDFDFYLRKLDLALSSLGDLVTEIENSDVWE